MRRMRNPLPSPGKRWLLKRPLQSGSRYRSERVPLILKYFRKRDWALVCVLMVFIMCQVYVDLGRTW